jgi:hypothetical protein
MRTYEMDLVYKPILDSYFLPSHTSLCEAPNLRYPLLKTMRLLGPSLSIKICEKVIAFKIAEFPQPGPVYNFVDDEEKDESDGLS